METMSSESEQRLHGEHELQMSKTEKSEQNDREIAAFLTKYGDLWLRERDLNPRPPGYEPDELPTALPRDIKLCPLSECLTIILSLYAFVKCFICILYFSVCFGFTAIKKAATSQNKSRRTLQFFSFENLSARLLRANNVSKRKNRDFRDAYQQPKFDDCHTLCNSKFPYLYCNKMCKA